MNERQLTESIKSQIAFAGIGSTSLEEFRNLNLDIDLFALENGFVYRIDEEKNRIYFTPNLGICIDCDD